MCKNRNVIPNCALLINISPAASPCKIVIYQETDNTENSVLMSRMNTISSDMK